MKKVTKANIIVKIINRWLYRYTNICIDRQPKFRKEDPVPDMVINHVIYPLAVHTIQPEENWLPINMIPGDVLHFEGVGNAIIIIKPNHIDNKYIKERLF